MFSCRMETFIYRNVNGVIEIILAQGNSGFIETNVDGYQGIIEFGNGTQQLRL